jgi:Zn-dependent protease
LEPSEIIEKLGQYLLLLFSLCIHESAHAWAALQMGDDTGYREGRISLNPLVHIDPIGTVLFPLINLFNPIGGFLLGWAKPTPVQPRYFRRFRLGQILTAGAGPGSNLLLAAAFAVVYAFAFRMSGPPQENPFLFLGFMGVSLNVALAVFNLIPLPPLDGSWIASWGLPRRLGDAYDRWLEPYGYWILMLLFISGLLGLIVGPISNVIASVLLRAAERGAA